MGSSFFCPNCEEIRTVTNADSRATKRGRRRRKYCLTCQQRFTTYEEAAHGGFKPTGALEAIASLQKDIGIAQDILTRVSGRIDSIREKLGITPPIQPDTQKGDKE